MKEIFKKLEKYPDYEVSNFGRVKRLEYKSKYKGIYYRVIKEKILNGTVDSVGYKTVDFKGKKMRVHQLVAVAFLNHKPNGFDVVVDHIDNNPLNNNLCNLQLVTNRYNASKDSKSKTSLGVFKSNNRYVSRIMINNKKVYLGCFKTEKEASEAYQNKLKEL